MSETENKTENTVETEAIDTAPYMKKPGHDKNKSDSTSSNMIIPAALVLVSAIVIGVTFYKDEDKAPLAQTETPVIATTEVEVVAEASNSEATIAETTETVEQATANTETVADETNATTAETSEQTIVAETQAPVAVNKSTVISEEEINMAATRPARTLYQYNPYNREQARAQAMAKHMKMLQQRRQAYERKMQDRRTKYETAMKAQQEKRAKVAEAKKAIFQRVQKDRLAAEQKIQQIHQQIAKLHEEIHQIMRESRKNAAPAQMHSM